MQHRWSENFGLQKRPRLFIGCSRTPVIGTIIVYWIRVYADGALPETSLVRPWDTMAKPRHGEPEFTPFDFTTIRLSHGSLIALVIRERAKSGQRAPAAARPQAQIHRRASSRERHPHVLLPRSWLHVHGGGARSELGGGVSVEDLFGLRVRCPTFAALNGDMTWPCCDLPSSLDHAAT